MRKKAIRSDVLDQLEFMMNADNGYTLSQREQASKLYYALRNEEWVPSEMFLLVIAILDNHHIQIPEFKKLVAAK